MPRAVDHEQRRAQIADALLRLASRDGLPAVTMRAVAEEAGVSLRLVQYYFNTKARLMLAALERLERQSNARWAERTAALPTPPPTRALLDAFVAEALPTDEPSRTFQLVWTSFAVLAMTDPALAEQRFAAGPARLERRLAQALERAAHDGELAPGVEPAAEAANLVALVHGLGASVLVGQRTAAEAEQLARRQIDRLFAAPRRAR